LKEIVMRKILLLAFGAALVLSAPSAIAAEDAAGKKVFKKCKACHSVKAGKRKAGPSLFGIVGRQAGTEKGFKFSKAMRKSDVIWDEASLDAFLKKPRKFMKGTRMSFRGLKKQADRENVITYLKQFSK
jgi:cytochrome c